jgi:hypothetical protein
VEAADRVRGLQHGHGVVDAGSDSRSTATGLVLPSHASSDVFAGSARRRPSRRRCRSRRARSRRAWRLRSLRRRRSARRSGRAKCTSAAPRRPGSRGGNRRKDWPQSGSGRARRRTAGRSTRSGRRCSDGSAGVERDDPLRADDAAAELRGARVDVTDAGARAHVVVAERDRARVDLGQAAPTV